MKNRTSKINSPWINADRVSASKTNYIIAIIVAISCIVCVARSACSFSATTSTDEFRIPKWTSEDFYIAIEKDNPRLVKRYLSDSDRSTQKFLSYYLLDYALELERDHIAMLLVEAGAGVDTRSAVRYENVQILNEMLKRGINPAGLSLAAERGNVDIVRVLLNHGEDALITEDTVRNGHLETLKLLLDHGAEPDGLEIAILRGHHEVAKLLLEFNADPNEITRLTVKDWEEIDFPPPYTFEYLSPLHYAVLNQSLDLVEAMLEAGADPNVAPRAITLLEHRSSDEDWPTVLQTAQDPEWGDDAIAQLLIEHGAEPHVLNSGEDAQLEIDLFKAAEEWDYEEVIRLLDLGAKPVGFGSFYYDYSERYNPKLIQAFVEAGADPNVFNDRAGGLMYTPTALTLMNGDVDNFNRFIQAGAEISSSLRGWYMKIALVNGLDDALEILWSLGEERRYIDIQGPINHGILRTAKTLLSKGARPRGLRTAVEDEHEGIVKALLEAGADPDELDEYDERSILELAIENGNREIIDMLREAGARN
ncbi:MAG: hypothetical protein F4W92_09420 [Gammaproteobacteria bacterium]|nr:hypothetical protein [Gammaproteobacteria bacterium]